MLTNRRNFLGMTGAGVVGGAINIKPAQSHGSPYDRGLNPVIAPYVIKQGPEGETWNVGYIYNEEEQTYLQMTEKEMHHAINCIINKKPDVLLWGHWSEWVMPTYPGEIL